MMGPKAAVYAVLAVTLGYILISAVPDQIVAIGGRSQPVQTPPSEVEGLEADAFAGESTAPPSSTFTLWDGAHTFGLWLIDLLIALGVYFLAKRRLS